MVLTYLVLIMLTTACALVISTRENRSYLLLLNLVQWIFYSIILYISHDIFPFAEGGDDALYYVIAREVRTIGDAFDPAYLSSRLAQPGYAMLLGPVSLMSQGDLFAMKLVNIACLVALTIFYSRIGTEVGGPEFGRLTALFVAGLSPLWNYYVFLLKDIPIALLQAVVLLGAIIVFKSHGVRGWLFVGIGTVLILPFRSFLAVMNVAVTATSVSLVAIGSGNRQRSGGFYVVVFLAFSLLFGLALVLTNPELAAIMGVASTQWISAENISTVAESRFSESTVQRALFPLLYFVSETSGLQTLFVGIEIDPARLRGVLALSWIFFYLPLLLVGGYSLLLRRTGTQLIRSPWAVVLAFCVGYLIVSWIVGDTTRWRLPDLPALAMIAALGFTSLAWPARIMLLAGWGTSVILLCSIFYLG